jgi:SAM-dependent methyltransferase
MEDKVKVYLEKENYITIHPDPATWRTHANYKVMQSFASYIKGKCGDLGCNHGSCTLLLLDFPVESVHGYDINIKALEIAYDNALKYQVGISGHESTKISFICANLMSIPIEANYFDFLMSFHTLEHIYPEDTDAVVSEISRILKVGGHILISIPYDHAYPDPHHVNFYMENNLSELFERHGFETVACFKDDRFEQKDLLTGLFVKKHAAL